MAKTTDPYEVRLRDRVVAHTDDLSLRYAPERERELQTAGYDIYINGRRLPKIRK